MPKPSNKDKALIALLGSNSIRDAARACGLSEVTIYRYLNDQEFRREYREARRQSVENAIGLIQQSTNEAAETLARNLHCESPAVEVRTAQIIMETAIKGLETMEILERLDRLENLDNRESNA